MRCLVIVYVVFFSCFAYAERTVWYVHPDSALNSIQAGLDSCADNDIVLVAPGTYYENIIWPNTQGIHLISELGPEVTIIDGDSIRSVIICLTGVDTTTIIRGFSIENGFSFVSGRGGGVMCHQSSPTIISNVIVNNTAIQNTTVGYGGGIYCYQSSPIIRNNTIHGNHARIGGGIACQESSPVITGNTIDSNITHGPLPEFAGKIYYTEAVVAALDKILIDENVCNIGRQAPADGAGIACWDNSTPLITYNTITNNDAFSLIASGGGIYCSNSTPTISYNTITYNFGAIAGGGGGIACSGPAAIITDNIIMGNGCGNGGGIATNSSSIIKANTITMNEAWWLTVGGNGGGIACFGDSAIPVISKNIIDMNFCSFSFGRGGGIYCDAASPRIDSCTISNNEEDGIYCCNNANPLINYCNITDNVQYGIHNEYTSVTINAEYNWWGDSTGPYHPDSNPGGLGDTVSDYVDFIPWLYWPGVDERTTVIPVSKQNIISPTIFRGPLQLPKDKACKVFDITGREVKPHLLAPGIYFIEVDGVVTQKVIKVR